MLNGKAIKLKTLGIRGSRGGDSGSGLPMEKHKAIGFHSSTGPVPKENHKVTDIQIALRRD